MNITNTRYPHFSVEEEPKLDPRQMEAQNRKEAYLENLKKFNAQAFRCKNSPRLFLDTEGLYTYDPFGTITSQELYTIYQDWCLKEGLPFFSPREFWREVKYLAPHYRMRYSGQILDHRGKRVRGFRGIRPLSPKDTHKP